MEPGTHTAGLTQAQLDEFDRHGYLVLDAPCEPDMVEAIRSEFEQRFRDDFDEGPKHMVDGVLYAKDDARSEYHWQRIMDAWRISDACRDLALAPAVLDALERLSGRKPLPFQTLNFPVGTQQAPHSDAMFFSSSPDRFMCGVWVALEDVDMENGPLVYYPGSHKLPTPTVDLVEEAIGEQLEPESFATVAELRGQRNRQYALYCRQLIEKEGLEPAYGTIRKGQALIWASNLLHGGAPQRDSTRTRHSQVTHYLFEDTRLVRPIWSEGDLTYWDYPIWVREEAPEYSREMLLRAVQAHAAPGSTVIVLTRRSEDLDLPGYEVREFPRESSEDPVATLEQLIEAGAGHMVVAVSGIPVLQAQMPQLQQLLETRYAPVFVDGALGAIYELG